MTAETTPEPLYRLHGVERSHRDGSRSVHAVAGIDLEIHTGEFVVIAGPSGSGKTTLLQLLGAIDRPTAGSLAFEGVDLGGLPDRALTRIRRREIGFVFQQFNLIPTLSARENVEAPMAVTGMGGGQRRARALELLAGVGLADRAHHLPSRLSGGEQQRVAIARALANRPRVILADEPTGNLDSATSGEIMALLGTLNERDNQTVVLITHDPAIAAGARRLLSMRDGRIVAEDGPGRHLERLPASTEAAV